MSDTVATSRLVNRTIIAESGSSSMPLELDIWDAVVGICKSETIPMATLLKKVDGGREIGGRTSAIGIFAFNYCRQAATKEGHRLAGHASTS